MTTPTSPEHLAEWIAEALPHDATEIAGHRPVWADDVPTGWCECGKPYPHDATEPAGPLDVERLDIAWHRATPPLTPAKVAAEYALLSSSDLQPEAPSRMFDRLYGASPGTPREDERLREALADARLTILAHYQPNLGDPRIRPSVVRTQVREIDSLLGNPPTAFPLDPEPSR